MLTSFRPGDFEMRQLDELIPMRHGVIGQETQGPGGFMMSLRSVAVFKGILADLDEVAPSARIFNYTNPVNIVSQAVEDSHRHADLLDVRGADDLLAVDPARPPAWTPTGLRSSWPASTTTAGRPPTCTTARTSCRCWTRAGSGSATTQRAASGRSGCCTWPWRCESIPADYFKYYYFGEEFFREQQASRLTRAGVILDACPATGRTTSSRPPPTPVLDPARSRGGIHELELAIDVMSAYYNDVSARLPVNLLNAGGALPGFDEDTVVEVWCDVDGAGAHPMPQHPLPHAVRGITQTLAEYQRLAATPRGRAPGPTRSGRWWRTRSSARSPWPRSCTTTWRTRTATYLPERLLR